MPLAAVGLPLNGDDRQAGRMVGSTMVTLAQHNQILRTIVSSDMVAVMDGLVAS